MKHFYGTMTFDYVAPFYDKLAGLVFGRRLLTAQQQAAQLIPAGIDVLLLGGGTGTLLPPFLREKHPRRVLYLEASVAMLNRAQQRDWHGHAVEFRHGTQASLHPTEQFDAILLPFVLDLYPEDTLRHQLLPPLLGALRPGGALYICDFDQPHTKEQQAILAIMITFFRMVARIPVRHLPDWPAVLTQLGLVEQQRQSENRAQLRIGRWVRSPTGFPGLSAQQSAT